MASTLSTLAASCTFLLLAGCGTGGGSSNTEYEEGSSNTEYERIEAVVFLSSSNSWLATRFLLSKQDRVIRKVLRLAQLPLAWTLGRTTVSGIGSGRTELQSSKTIQTSAIRGGIG
jgi:hypothetical protein